MERLHQTHDSLHAFRPRGPVEAILGPVEPEPTPMFELPEPAPRPEWLTAVNACDVPSAEFVWDRRPVHPRWLDDRLTAILDPMECLGEVYHPSTPGVELDCGFEFAGAVHIEFAAPAPADTRFEHPSAPIFWDPRPFTALTLDAAPVTLEMDLPQEDPVPFCLALLSLGQPSLANCVSAATDHEPLAVVLRVQLPLDAIRLDTAPVPAALLHAGLRALPVGGITIAAVPSTDSLRAYEFHGDAQFDLAMPLLRPRLRLAAGRRYLIASREVAPSIAIAELASVPGLPPEVSLPERKASVLRAASVQPQMQEPNPAGPVAIACAAVPADFKTGIHPVPAALSLPQPPRTEPMRPFSKLEPIDAKPVSDFVYAPPPQAAPVMDIPELRPPHPHVWTHAIDFWNRAPRDLKILVIAIPLLLGLALHPSLPKVRFAAPTASTSARKTFRNAMNDQWSNVRQSMVQRAAVALDEDFRAGLDDWVSRGDATTEWSFDATGFVRPGPLAMYRPSMGLTDYQMQFLGMLDKKALSWVVRAVDFDNYYVIKLVVLKGGPVPTIGVTRYAVINGKSVSRADTVVPVDARQDMLYRVHLDVHGDDFALSVQGQMVDSWSEARLTHGGIGFFAAPGEESRLRWVQVTHQYDMLGRLCAYLAPYNVASANGSWQQ